MNNNEQSDEFYRNIEFIKNMRNAKPRHYVKMIKSKYKDVYNWVYENKPKNLESDDFVEIFYWLVNGMTDYPTCPMDGNKITNFVRFESGYPSHCCAYCSWNDPKRIKKIRSSITPEVEKMRLEKIIAKNRSRTKEQAKNCSLKSRKTRLEKYGSETYVNSEKAKMTCLERYGVEHPSKNEAVKRKLVETRARSYYNNTFVGNSYLEPLFTEDEYVETCIKGNHLTFEFEWRCRLCGSVFKSKLNGNWFTKGIGRCYARCLNCFPILNDYLHSRRELDCAKYVCSLVGNDRVMWNDDKGLGKIIKGFNIDIYIPDLKIAFEFNGLRWHNINQLRHNYHLNKTKLCEDAGIKLMHIWEDEWDFKHDIVIEDIHNFINGKYSYAVNGDLITVDRAKYNKLCTFEGYELESETDVNVIKRTNSNNISYDVEDCGNLIYRKIS